MQMQLEAASTLLHTCEELLFSIPLPPDIVNKYETLRMETLAKSGLQWPSRIQSLQKIAHLKQSNEGTQGFLQEGLDKNKELLKQSLSQLEICYTTLQNISSKINFMLDLRQISRTSNPLSTPLNSMSQKTHEKQLKSSQKEVEENLGGFLQGFQKIESQLYENLDLLVQNFQEQENKIKHLSTELENSKLQFTKSQQNLQIEAETLKEKLQQLHLQIQKQNKLQTSQIQDYQSLKRSSNFQETVDYQERFDQIQIQNEKVAQERDKLEKSNEILTRENQNLYQQLQDLKKEKELEKVKFQSSQNNEISLQAELKKMRNGQTQLIQDIRNSYEAEIQKMQAMFMNEIERLKKRDNQSYQGQEVSELQEILQNCHEENQSLIQEIKVMRLRREEEITTIIQSLQPLQRI